MVLTALRAPSDRQLAGEKLSFQPTSSCHLLSPECQSHGQSRVQLAACFNEPVRVGEAGTAWAEEAASLDAEGSRPNWKPALHLGRQACSLPGARKEGAQRPLHTHHVTSCVTTTASLLTLPASRLPTTHQIHSAARVT